MPLDAHHNNNLRLLSGCRALRRWPPGSHDIATYPDTGAYAGWLRDENAWREKRC